jgi:hypothetical protein
LIQVLTVTKLYESDFSIGVFAGQVTVTLKECANEIHRFKTVPVGGRVAE